MSNYPLNPDRGVILIDTTVIGPKRKHTFKAILDTGASYTLVDPAILIMAGYDVGRAKQRKPITTASGIEYCPFINVKAFETLGHSLRDLEICVHSLPSNLPAKGLLGINFLKYFNVDLHFLDRSLILSKHGSK